MDQCLHHKAQVWETPALPAQGVGAALVVAGAAQEGQQSVAKGLLIVGERDGLNICCPLRKTTLLLEASATTYCLPFTDDSQSATKVKTLTVQKLPTTKVPTFEKS